MSAETFLAQHTHAASLLDPSFRRHVRLLRTSRVKHLRAVLVSPAASSWSHSRLVPELLKKRFKCQKHSPGLVQLRWNTDGFAAGCRKYLWFESAGKAVHGEAKDE